MAEVYIGCSGYSYRHWRGNFYPDDLPTKKWFSHYQTLFSTVELNVTFYRTPNAETFRRWHDESPGHFVFAVKGSRFITHIKKLLDPEVNLERFFLPAFELKEKMSVVLWQLPPSFKVDLERLAPFLAQLDNYRVRHTIEFRHESWFIPEVTELLQKHGVTFCMADWPPFLDAPPPTTDFVYIRRHGYRGTYNGNYTSETIAQDATRIEQYLAEGRDVYIYYNNDLGGHAPRNAVELSGILQERGREKEAQR
ncbi:DUF72 domain-containing protein [Geomonas sp. RF6]|uniref:DUF72 domain-containing protein n=1 Tax=Geomonas sp. RF6 TaxID=2897342 RepID=UPI001E2B3204|nr:DUF72 domain-containing protein [Geomonas sp. RF6]UFS69820.1 DUF72 domain-containing protein [Geomonas sp. RF6]